MTYGLSPRLFVENGPAVRAAEVRDAHRSWRALDPDNRFALIQTALRPANDQDGLPIAL
jgi:hypothetical protein